MNEKGRDEEKQLVSTVLLLNAKILGLTLGILLGLLIFTATNWLLIKGGHVDQNGNYVVGPNLQLLGQFFIGYRVSFLGSLIGFGYGFLTGAVCGGLIGWVYNKIVWFKNR